MTTTRRLILLPLLAFVLALTGCNQQALFDKFLPKEEAAQARHLVAQLAAQDYAAIEAQLDSDLRTPELRANLENMAKLIPQGEPQNVHTVGAYTSSVNDVTRYDLTFEYQYPDSWLIASAVLERRDGKMRVLGLRITPRTQSLAAENAFTLTDKGALHYLVLALAVSIPLFVVYAIVLCVRTPIAKRKWLWVLFVAVGLVQFHFNWATGAWNVLPVAASLLGAGVTRSGPVAPWVITLALPVGALVFLAKRKSFTASQDASSAGS